MRHPILIFTLALTTMTSVMMVEAATHPKTLSSTTPTNISESYTGGFGEIIAVDIQAKTIQIGKIVYGIADGVLVVNNDNELLSQLALTPGENIEFNLAAQPLTTAGNSVLPAQVMTQIRIINGLNHDHILK